MKRMEDDSCKITESQQEGMALVEGELSESREKCKRLEAEVSALREENSIKTKQIERKLKVGKDLLCWCCYRVHVIVSIFINEFVLRSALKVGGCSSAGSP